MTPRQLERYRSLLVERLTALYREVHADFRDSMIREIFDQDQPRDEADESQRVQLRDLQTRLAEGDAARAQMIEGALRRIARGEFGQCIDCGNPIGTQRLNLVPWTPRCVDCQEAVEAEARARPPTL